ncbi:MAG: hypothetical protein LUD77_08250 [Clostridiales bacterium]|nr:hypothetical protein [Clostridiales bacterium]
MINIPPELTKQTMMQLQGQGEKVMSRKADNSENSGNGGEGCSGSENQNNQNETEGGFGNLSKADGISPGNAANKSRGSENGTNSINRGSENGEGNISTGNSENLGNENNVRTENKDSSEGNPSTDSGEPKSVNEYASEFSSILNKDKASMDMNTYKELLSEAKRYLDESPIAYDNSGFGKRIAETHKRLYKVSSVWWKKAQSMIMGYVPDVNSSYRRPNKKFAMTEFILPSQCEKALSCEVDRLRVFLDSSGSMTSEDFNIFKSLIKSAQSFFPRDTLAYEFNTAVSHMKCVNGKIIGSPAHIGGTDINCVTKFISTQPDKGKALNIVVTDGGFDLEVLASYMKKEDRLSKFIFIITTANKDYLSAVKGISPKRLKVLPINEYGKF